MDDLFEGVRDEGVAFLGKGIEAARAVLASLELDPRHARTLLGAIFAYVDEETLRTPAEIAEEAFEAAGAGDTARAAMEDEDDRAQREAARALRAAVSAMEEGPTRETAEAALAAFSVWKRASGASTLRFVLDSAAMLRVQTGAQSPPPRMVREARALGGEDAVAEVRRRMRAEPLDQGQVERTLRRAFWDAAEERVRGGDVETLWSLCAELKDTMRALLFAAPRAAERLDAEFDLDLLRPQVGLADFPQTLGRAVRHVVSVVRDMVAAVDAPQVAEWEGRVEVGLQRRDWTMADYLADRETGLLAFARGGLEIMERQRRRVASITQGGDGRLEGEGDGT
ncbi:MAG: hypothetical protein VYE81_07485 [Planctomycetota bacterium]|nr:hypothetical protein [Planctomycetota bacterium]